MPPCGYCPVVHLLRLPYYAGLVFHPNLRWVPLCDSPCGSSVCSAVPITEWRRADARYTLIISHGNGQDLQYLTNDVAPRLQALRTPVNLVCYEYPGYSLSSLPTTEALCLRAAEAVYHDVCKSTAATTVVMYGISLGTGPAMHIAAHFDVGGLILQSPYTSIGATKVGLSTARRLAWIDLFRSYTLAPCVQVPVQIYHGSADASPQCSTDLSALFARVMGESPVFCSGAGHNDLIELLHERGQFLPMLDRYLAHLSDEVSRAADGDAKRDEMGVA